MNSKVQVRISVTDVQGFEPDPTASFMCYAFMQPNQRAE